MKTLTFVAALTLAVFASHRALAATSANASSPLGINLNYMSYYDPEQPFLNIFKTTAITHNNPAAWSTRSGNMAETKEESYLQLDSDGYPTTLQASSADAKQQFTQVCALILKLQPSNAGTGAPYRAGQYVILYDGAGTIQVSMDAKMVSSSPGRDVFNVANPTQNGVWICITKSDPGNHVRNIRVVKAEEESLLDQGGTYTPKFLSLMQNFSVIRAMQWLKIDDPPQGPPGAWADRSQVSDAGWGSEAGVPLEAVISLCNAVSADCWINVPHSADDNYITQLATLVHQQLGSGQKAYVEFSNEVWNGDYPQYQYAISKGLAEWPGNTNPYVANRNWYGMRTAQMCDIWAQVWGADFSRVHCVMGAQAAWTYSATEALDCPLWSAGPCYKHHFTDVAIAPYFGWAPAQAAASWNSAGVASVVDDIFGQINSGGLIAKGYGGGALKQASDWEAAYKTALAPYGLPFIAYEGGQGLTPFPAYYNGSTVVNAFITANRDNRMATAYSAALTAWKANGGHTYVLYDDVYAPQEYGEWGALESFMDTVSPLTSAPPKWRAIQNFISSTPCWWPACTGTISTSPRTPSNFKSSQ